MAMAALQRGHRATGSSEMYAQFGQTRAATGSLGFLIGTRLVAMDWRYPTEGAG